MEKCESKISFIKFHISWLQVNFKSTSSWNIINWNEIQMTNNFHRSTNDAVSSTTSVITQLPLLVPRGFPLGPRCHVPDTRHSPLKSCDVPVNIQYIYSCLYRGRSQGVEGQHLDTFLTGKGFPNTALGSNTPFSRTSDKPPWIIMS